MNEELVNELRKIAVRAPQDPEHKLCGLAAQVIERLSSRAERADGLERELFLTNIEVDRLREVERTLTKSRDWYYRGLEELASHSNPGVAYIAKTALRIG